MKRYNKAIAATVGAIVGWLVATGLIPAGMGEGLAQPATMLVTSVLAVVFGPRNDD